MKTALEAAVEQLANYPDLEDAERPIVDSDTSNVPGSPPIAETILRKIRDCAVFVADVTPVGQSTGGKKLVNPNVMIELGYALAQVGSERIVLVMNQAEGGMLRALPFDLRHWRGPLTYSLGRDATDQRRDEVQVALIKDLVERLGPSLAFAAAGRQPALVAQGVPADEADPAVWAGAKPLVQVRAKYDGDMALCVVDGPKVFARIIPAASFDATRADLSTYHGTGYPLGILGDYENHWLGISPDGAAAWNIVQNKVRSLTQWFQANGEIWGIWPDALVAWDGQLTFTDVCAARGLAKFISQNFATLTRFSAPLPWRVIVGVHGLEGSVLPRARYSRDGRSALANSASFERAVTEPTAAIAREITFGFMRRIYDAYGAPNLDEATFEQLLREAG